MELTGTGYWNEKKVKLKQKYNFISDDDLHFHGGKEQEMMEILGYKLEGTSYTVIGLDGILGIEYNFVEAPFNISLDWKPAFNLVGYSGFWADGGALSVRYIF